VRAVLVGPVGQADVSSQFLGYYYAVPVDADASKRSRLWRPGLFVQAHLLAPAAETVEPNAVVVPAAAVLYHQGRTLVYLQSAADKYERREVQILGFRDDLCYLAERSLLAPPTVGIVAGDKVVSSGAQALLSTEFRRDGDDD
jgi:multidrug efflux pump subunit AcrA (membrane-fusion protein)